MNNSIAGKPAQAIVKAGISHVPEGRRVFADMSVEENIELGAFLRKDKAGIQQIFKKYMRFSRAYENVKNSIRNVIWRRTTDVSDGESYHGEAETCSIR